MQGNKHQNKIVEENSFIYFQYEHIKQLKINGKHSNDLLAIHQVLEKWEARKYLPVG